LNILKAPIPENTNSFTQNKFNLTWYSFIVYFFILILLSLIHYTNSPANFLITIIGLTYCGLSILFLALTKTHLLVSKVTSIICTIIIQYTIYSLINPDRTVDVIWIIIFSLFTFYTVNVKWGISVLFINFLGLAIHQVILYNYFNITVHSTPIVEATYSDQLDYYINFGFGVLFMTYLIIKLINEHKHVTNELELKNKLVNDQNDEKTVLLKEIHHRVKNNLQIISSLLRMQSRDIDDETTVKQFDDATNRVVAMSLIHDKMYQSKNLSKINLKDYLETLSSELISSYSIDTPVNIKVNTELELITPKFLVSFALIFNELITNSLKHGLKNKADGIIRIKILKTDSTLEITYFDNGDWIKSTNKKSFGLELIDTLTEQLDGEYIRDNTSGTHYKFIIPFISKNIN
jgi:two-component sensor histidine kinase